MSRLHVCPYKFEDLFRSDFVANIDENTLPIHEKDFNGQKTKLKMSLMDGVNIIHQPRSIDKFVSSPCDLWINGRDTGRIIDRGIRLLERDPSARNFEFTISFPPALFDA